MLLPKCSFRVWRQPSRRVDDGPEVRGVTFLELFYALIYVVLMPDSDTRSRSTSICADSPASRFSS